MVPHQQIIQWLRTDPYRMQALYTARELGLNQWCLAAGFVRNLVWDQLHGYLSPTPLNDIDLVYFDKKDISEQHDLQLEALLLNKHMPHKQTVHKQMVHKQTAQKNRFPWSVKTRRGCIYIAAACRIPALKMPSAIGLKSKPLLVPDSQMRAKSN